MGDDDQSIYRWRGADITNILDFEKDHPDSHLVRLEQNYRSTGTILAAANSLIRQNEGRKGKELWTENGEGDPVLVLEVPDEQAEAMAALRFVKGAIEEEGRDASDFVVLYRTNAQSRVLENTFQLGGVPYQVVGGQRFYDRREIKDVLAFLRLLVNPEDDVATRRVINVPPRGVGKKSQEDLEEFARENEMSLLEAMRKSTYEEGAPIRPALRAKLSEFFEILDRAASRMAADPVGVITERLLEDVGYEEYLEKESERDSVNRWENVTELLNAMQEFADSPDREDVSVTAFLEEVSLFTDLDDYEEDAPRVTLMTLHNAKGLEFPWVMITGLEEGLFPHVNSIQEPGGLEEERRLFYVGVTRAESQVVLMTAGARRRFGAFDVCVPSRFLEEIDPELVERKRLGPDPTRSRPPVSAPTSSWPSRRKSPEDTPDYLPSYEDESQVGDVQPGMRVRHPSWGEGVIDAVEGSGQNLKLTIRFRGDVRKKVLAIYAKLELLS